MHRQHHGFLRPVPTLTEKEVARSLRLMVWEGVASSVTFSLGSGGFIAAYALALGANNFQIGILTALPFISQVMQVPGILLVERFRLRKAIGLPFWLVAQLMWVAVGVVPFLIDAPGAAAVSFVIFFLGIRGLFSPIWAVCSTSWMRDLVPQAVLGSYYGRRQAIITVATAVVGLAGSYFVDWWQRRAGPDDDIFAYSFLLICGALTFGLAAVTFASRAAEPLMPPVTTGRGSPLIALQEPFQDRNYLQLLRFLFFWNLASNLAIPFFAVYMLTQLGLSLPAVVSLTVLSHGFHVLFVRAWGPLADKVGSKTVLSMSASLYLLVIVGWAFTTMPERYVLTLPLLVVLHAFAGIASAGVTLTVGTLALKIAPEGRATSFLGIAGIATNVGAGLGPLVGGRFADYFSERALTVGFTWTAPSGSIQFSGISLTGFDFLFAIAFILGLLSLNLLVALREVGEVPREAAVRELTSAVDFIGRAASSVPGVGLVSAYAYGYLRRIPGLEVAMGVTAYQLAASTEAVAKAMGGSRVVVRTVAERIGSVVGQAVQGIGNSGEQHSEIGRHATRGAVLAASQASKITQGAVVGTLRALAADTVEPARLLRSVSYGAIEGAVQGGADMAATVAETIEGAREAAGLFRMTPDEAAREAAQGVLEAAQAAGPATLQAVQEALPEELRGP